MPTPNQAALDFLLTRRSRPAKTLKLPVPDAEALGPILTAAARTPDHGKLEPWRFVVLTRPAMERLGRMVLDLEPDEERAAKGAAQFLEGQLAVVVVASPKPSDKIPEVEQTLSAGAVCLSLLNAALAAGWGANWLSGWPAHDRRFAEPAFGLGPDEWIAGIVHIGTESATPPDRPRPDLSAITTWMTE